MTWFLAAALLMQAQDEVRVSSRNYVPTLRVDTQLVEVVAVVRDAHGKAVAGLTKGDFHVLDDGKERTIDHFVVESVVPEIHDHKPVQKPGLPEAPVGPPRFLALFIDDVNGKDEALAADLPRTRAAAEKFVKEALRS